MYGKSSRWEKCCFNENRWFQCKQKKKSEINFYKTGVRLLSTHENYSINPTGLYKLITRCFKHFLILMKSAFKGLRIDPKFRIFERKQLRSRPNCVYGLKYFCMTFKYYFILLFSLVSRIHSILGQIKPFTYKKLTTFRFWLKVRTS